MASVNKVILLGSLGRDPEVRYMPNGEAVCNFSIATTERWKDKSGNKQERTDWHQIVMYRKLAEIAGEYLEKGRPVYIEGRLQTRKWEKDDITHYTTEVIADQMQMLGGKNASNQDDDADSQPAKDKAPSGKKQPPSMDDFEDDIPF